jgi:hypothetical protein
VAPTLSLSSPVSPTLGGTGITSYVVGDLLYANTTTSLAKLADVATGNALRSGGVGVAPSWGKINLSTDVTGTLPLGNGGTGNTIGQPTAINYTTSSTSSLAFSSATFTAHSGLTAYTGTTAGGIYLVLVTTWGAVSNGSRTGQLAIYNAGVQQTQTIRGMSSASNNCIGTTAIVTVASTNDAIEPRFALIGGSGTLTTFECSMNVVRLA